MNEYISSLASASYWLKTGHRADYPELEDHVETEVAVIGAGIGGILTAYRLLKEGKKVTLFERFRILNGTTGNTTAKLSAQHGLNYAKLMERYGEKRARLYYRANMQGIETIKAVCRELGLNNLVEDETVYTFTTDPAKVSLFEAEKEAYDTLGIKGNLSTETPLGFKVEAALSMLNQGTFHPVEFLNGVLTAAVKQGLKVYENTCIETEMEQKSGSSIILKDSKGHEIHCKQVVFATHYPLVEQDDHYDMLWARSTHALAYKTDKKLFEGAHISYDTPSVTLRTMEYFGDHYFLIGGQSHGTGDGFSDEERYEKIHELAKNYFDVKVPVFKWAAHDLMTPDHVPYIGRLHPDIPDAYTITGLNAWGLANSSVAALVITDLICGRDNPYKEMYDPYREIKAIDSDSAAEQSSSMVKEVLKTEVAALKPDQMTKIKHGDLNVGVYKDKNGKVHYMDLACTHRGCELGLNDGDKTWDCPCHGSRFDKFGRVIYGPAIKDLSKLNVEE